MSKPKILDAYTKESKTITSVEADYAVAVAWSDDNPRGENRIGYFVSNDNTSSTGMKIVKANSTSRVLGVTVEDPGFSTNVPISICDECNRLLPSFSYVSIAGFAPVIDNGNCQVNQMCLPSSEGTAIPSSNEGYRVIDRIDSNHILIHLDYISVGKIIKVEGTTLVIS